MEIQIINHNDTPTIVLPIGEFGLKLNLFVKKHRQKIRKIKNDIREGKYKQITLKDDEL